MNNTQALRLEFFIIGLGILALILIFQPFNIVLFSAGCMIVVLAGLLNNLLPLARTGVPARSVITVAMVIAMIFCIVVLISITAAHLYGAFFLNPPDPNTASGRAMALAPKFWQHPFVWSVAGLAAVLAALIWRRTK